MSKANQRFDRITQLLLAPTEQSQEFSKGGGENQAQTNSRFFLDKTSETTPVKLKKPKSIGDKSMFMTPDQKMLPPSKLMMITGVKDPKKSLEGKSYSHMH